MSGIAGFVHFDGQPALINNVQNMTAAISYRGPDGIFHWCQGPAAMGHCMLHTTPESLQENQPLQNNEGTLVLTMDGRVDNWQQLRRELLGRKVTLRDNSDAELVLRAYETWGEKCLSHIDGDFALVIWNTITQELFCARDPVGNKPFYYHWDGKTFAFASELHTILTLPWVKADRNLSMFAQYLACEWYSLDETCWNDILRLPFAHHMTVRGDTPQPTQYWTPDLNSQLKYKSEQEFTEHYLGLFTDIVKRMSRSHTGLACEVSGGLDSSAIYAMAKNLERENALLAPSIEAYTLDFSNIPDADEMDYAREVGKFWQSKIHEIPPKESPLSWYRQWARHYQTLPPYPNGTMGLGISSLAAGKGSRVLFAGVGGDEWLGGSLSYYSELASSLELTTLYRVFARDAADTGFPTTLWWLLRYGLAPLFPNGLINSYRRLNRNRSTNERLRSSWLTNSLQGSLQEKRKMHAFGKATPTNYNHQYQLQILHDAYGVHAREMEELLSARVGLELRHPYCHKDLIQFSFSTPAQWRTNGHTDRQLHRTAMAGLLPDSILSRLTKANFTCTFVQPLSQVRREYNAISATVDKHWVNPDTSIQLWKNTHPTQAGGLPEWMLWSQFITHCLVSNPSPGLR